LTALTALRAWTHHRDRMPEQRAALLSAAWRAGERNVRELARLADVSRQTVYDDLRALGIEPTHRDSEVGLPQYVPLSHDQVAGLADQITAAIAPALLCMEPDPMAKVAQELAHMLTAISIVLDRDRVPSHEDDGRADWLFTIACSANRVRRAAHAQWASETDDAELVQFTASQAEVGARIGDAALVEEATLTLRLANGATTQVAITTVGHDDVEPTRWTSKDGALALPPVDGVRHLEITALLTSLSEVITEAVYPQLR
jgi:hypothetical protein